MYNILVKRSQLHFQLSRTFSSLFQWRLLVIICQTTSALKLTLSSAQTSQLPSNTEEIPGYRLSLVEISQNPLKGTRQSAERFRLQAFIRSETHGCLLGGPKLQQFARSLRTNSLQGSSVHVIYTPSASKHLIYCE